jgi:opacity protein-like surface antigen
MRKLLTAALAALTFGGAVAATAVPAQARPYGYGGHYRYYGGYRHHGDSTGAALAGGIVGLALGAAIASSGSRDRYYGGSYYGRGYYPRYGYSYYDYGYDYAPRTCESRRQSYDPYSGREYSERRVYPC